MKHKLLPFLFLLSLQVTAQTGWVFNTDITRGNVNQYIYIESESKNDLLASSEKISLPPDTFITKITTGDSGFNTIKKKPFIPTPSNASKAGLIMMDSVINGKKVKIIKEDLSDVTATASSSPVGGGYENVAIGTTSGFSNTMIGSQAGINIQSGGIPDDKPKPGEKLYPCKYCDMRRTIKHIKYIARLYGEGWVEIKKGVWVKTEE